MRTICPNCKEETLEVTTYKEDGYIVEIDKKCKCGYHYDWAYGNITIYNMEDEANG